MPLKQWHLTHKLNLSLNNYPHNAILDRTLQLEIALYFLALILVCSEWDNPYTFFESQDFETLKDEQPFI